MQPLSIFLVIYDGLGISVFTLVIPTYQLPVVAAMPNLPSLISWYSMSICSSHPGYPDVDPIPFILSVLYLTLSNSTLAASIFVCYNVEVISSSPLKA